MRTLFILCLGVASISAFKESIDDNINRNTYNACDDVECRAGRECIALKYGPQCVCISTCPDHFRPVCGSDDNTYDNHCLLHQTACLKDHPISIKHKGFCKKLTKKYKNDPYLKKLKKEKLSKAMDNEIPKEVKKPNTKNHPATCYSSERDTLRDLIIQNWEITLKSQPWHVEGMTYRESLWGRFFTCDVDKNNYLTPDELFACSDDTLLVARPGQDEALTKALCIDALVDDGDDNQDWRLDFEEFTHVMNPLYHPEPKECSLEGKKYTDGKEVHVDCNHCVCAAGNWVCTSNDCEENDDKKQEEKVSKTDHLKNKTIKDKYLEKKKSFSKIKDYKKTPKNNKKVKDSFDNFDYYDESDEDYLDDYDEDDDVKNEDEKENPKIWEEFLLHRAIKRRKEGKKADLWDDLVELDNML